MKGKPHSSLIGNLALRPANRIPVEKRSPTLVFTASSLLRSTMGMRLSAVILVGIFAAQGYAATITVSHLRCENLIDPLGIDVANPRLSWILDSDQPNEKQTAYEIVVDGQWDSGRIDSDQSIDVEYGGKGLAPATRYAWKVRVWDAEGNPSAWSKPSTFSTALKQWSAKWIGRDESEGNPESRRVPARYLRREFSITKRVTRATAYVCGLGFFDLFLNGEKFPKDVMDPALSDYAKADYVCDI